MAALRVHQRYQQLLEQYRQSREKESRQAVAFLQHNIQRAKWFIQAVEQRHRTLVKILQALVEVQRRFFEEEELALLRPLTLRELAGKVAMDVSTISRAVSGKSLRTAGSLYPLKFFFSEAIPTTGGGVVSSRFVKQLLAAAIQEEESGHPYSDETLAGRLAAQGLHLARRTVAKYRKELGFPSSHWRRVR